ncbi:predicted protein [Naegleria gruberi]|uniref:Predicted protein n=1 Tax=Naegleria gruberi TaxID=5762 RepID=D2VWD4_NAEGR|nr:uncharacterized protein NAEGRDRAFT_52786 [Naegleria gruberi]EFC38815.1 predicted protein [Naegleria gruberi]|eukprot:XP_002671559.1 predicted protein [Naegleria gruberi strain NEG-M]
MHVIDKQSQLRDISQPFTVVSIRKYYTSFVNHLAPIMTSGVEFLSDSRPLQEYFNVYCVYTSVFSSGNLAPNDNSILSNLNSSICSSINHLDDSNMPIDAAHNSYLVLNQEPSIIFSPNSLLPLWSIILKNAMVDQTMRYKVWNYSISETFTMYALYDKATSMEYVLDSDLVSNREGIVKELEEEIWNDCKLFERVYEIQMREGLGLGFSSISISENRICNETLQNSTFMEEYHQAILRIDLYLNLMLNYSNLVNTTGSLTQMLPSSTFYFMDNLIATFNPTFLVEAIRNVLQNGGFNTYLSYSKPSSNYDMEYFSMLQKSDLKPVSQLMIHPNCFCYYNLIDLFIMILMMGSVIPIIVGSVEDGTPYFIVRKVFTVVFFVMFYAIIGGTVTIAHWINKFRRLKSKYRNAQVTTLESFLEDQQFREMFRTYSKNEFSLENIIMYEELEKLKKNNKVTPQELKSLQEKFLLSSSVHEVNYPSAVKKNFQELLDSYKDEDVSSNDSDSTTQTKSSNSLKQSTGLPKKGTVMLEKMLELVMPELLKNMFDTFSRLKTTPEFGHWFEMKQIQTTELGEEQHQEQPKDEKV